MKAWRILFVAGCAAAAMLLLSGCTLVGLAVGGMIGETLPKQEILPPSEAYTIGWATPIEIIGTGGQRVSGQFNGLSRVSPEDYAAAYRQALSKIDTSLILPFPGDSLHIVTNRFQIFDGPFVSADTQGIRLLVPASNTEQDVPYRMIRELSGERGAISQDALRELVTTHLLPSSFALAVSEHGKRVYFPVDSVLQIQVPYKSRGSKIGAAVGLVVDLAVLYAILVRNSEYERGHDAGFQDGRDAWNRDH